MLEEREVDRPEVVAEISANHNGSLDRALDIISAVADTGATSIKLQTYTPDTITLDCDEPHFNVPKSQKLWGNRRLFDLYQEAHTPWSWHEPLFNHARKLGLDVFSTPFDETAVDFLEALDVSRYKVASLEIIDIPLIERIAATGKPMILSTGASTLPEVSEAISAIRRVGDIDITLLVCSSSYPAQPRDSNLRSMKTLESRFTTKVGFSDHTVGISSAVAAAILGASVIEKHVSLKDSTPGPDDAFSSTPEELKFMIEVIEEAMQSLGSQEIFVAESEDLARTLRPSIWITADVSAGAYVSTENIATLRPSGGLAPSSMNSVIGKRFARNAQKGTALTLDLLAD